MVVIFEVVKVCNFEDEQIVYLLLDEWIVNGTNDFVKTYDCANLFLLFFVFGGEKG